MKTFVTAAAFATLLAPAALAEDYEKVRASGSVDTTMDALVAAVEGAGATVFARVDHAGGAASVDMELAPMQLLVFGNPKLGTPALQADPLAGLELPLRVLVYEDGEGQVWLAYEAVDAMFEDLAIDDDAEFIARMKGALETLTGKAAGG